MSDRQRSNEGLFLFPPARAVAVSLQEYEKRQNAPYRIDFGVPIIDEYMVPMMAGDVMVVQGRPGHAKTSTLISMARRASQLTDALSRQGDDAIVVFATWETTIEEFVGLLTSHQSGQTLQMIARGQADLKKIAKAAVITLQQRIYVIGYSSQDPNPVPLTLDRVVAVLHHLQKNNKRLALVLWDYLQRMPAQRPGMNDKERVGSNARGIKDASTMCGFPSAVAVQAGRQVDEYKGLKLPALNDPQWSSTIEQDADKMLSITRPCLYMAPGSLINNTYDGMQYEVTKQTIVLGWPKQRWADAGAIFVLRFNPETLTFSEAKPVGKIPDEDEEDVF
jgi:replicative DNA helicase